MSLGAALALCEPPAPVETPSDPGRTAAPLRSGDVCPACGAGKMDYDGLLNLRCERCGYAECGGCFT